MKKKKIQIIREKEVKRKTNEAGFLKLKSIAGFQSIGIRNCRMIRAPQAEIFICNDVDQNIVGYSQND
jgi:hypothetical protein